VLRVVVDADANPSVAQRYGASTFPQLVVVDGDGKEVGRIEGRPNAAAQARLERLLWAARALQRSNRAADGSPEDAPSLFREGTHHWNRGDRSAAVQCFRKLVALPSSRDDGAENMLGSALCYLGQYELDRDDPESAETCFRQAQSRIKDPEGKYRCAFSLAMSLRKQGRPGEATSVLENYLSQASGSPWAGQALFALGYLKRESGDGEGARRHFQACRDLASGGLYGERSGRYLDVSGSPDSAPGTGDLARHP
jgi:tetratricopeptide (TPR) repeat protein